LRRRVCGRQRGNGTPTFFINGRRYEGPHDAVSIIAAMRTALLLASPGRVYHR
jgi:hypothetical protein